MLGRISTCEINFKCLKKVNSGFIILKDKDEVLENPEQFFPLYEFKFNEQLFTLYKAVSAKDRHRCFKDNIN